MARKKINYLEALCNLITKILTRLFIGILVILVLFGSTLNYNFSLVKAKEQVQRNVIEKTSGYFDAIKRIWKYIV